MPLGEFHLCVDEIPPRCSLAISAGPVQPLLRSELLLHPSQSNWDALVTASVGDHKCQREMKKGRKMRGLGEDEGLTLACRGPAGVCFHSAVSPDELPDVVFWG